MRSPGAIPPERDEASAPSAGLPRARARRPWPRLQVWVPALYVLVAGTWVAFSDLLVASWAHSPGEQARWSIAKGIGFVAVTAALLHAGLRWALSRQERAYGELATSEERLRLLVEHTPAAVAMFDREMTYLAASERFAADYRLRQRDLVGRSHYEVFPELPERWKEIHQRCLAGAVERCDEDCFTRLDGQVDWLRWEIRPWRDAAGEVGGLVLFSEIITDRKLAETKLVAEKERLAVTLRSIGDAVVATDEGACITLFNPEAERLTGWTAAEAEGRSVHEVVRVLDEDTRRPATDLVDRALREDGAVGSAAHRAILVARDGTERPIADRAAPMPDGEGRVSGAVLVLRDQADERRAERALREELAVKDQLAKIAASVPGAICSYRLTPGGASCMPFGTDALEELYGISREALADDMAPVLARVHPDDAERLGASIAESARTMSRWHAAYRYEHPTKGLRWIEGWSVPKAEPDGSTLWHGFVMDVTDRRRAELALAESEALHRSLFTLTPSGVVLLDAAGAIRTFNDQAYRQLGYTREEFARLRVTDIDVAEPGRADVSRHLARIADVGGDQFTASHRTKSGELREVLVDSRPIEIGGERHFLAVWQDVTDRTRAAAALRESEGRFRAIFEQVGVGMAEIEAATGRFVRVNDKLCQTFGYAREEILGRCWQDFTHPEDLPADVARFEEMLAAPAPYSRLKRYVRRDGTPVWAELTLAPMCAPGEIPTSAVSVVQDVTDRKRAEEALAKSEDELRQAQKLESIGRLAGGVAHDFNNILTVILSCVAELLDGGHLDESERREDLEEIRGAAVRASELTRQLLAFARKQVIAPVPVDLNELVRGTEKLLRRVLGEDVELAVALERDLWTVRCDPGQMEQVLMNLAVNARDAMPDGGRFTMETYNARVGPADLAREGDLEPGDWVRLVVRDSGVGMPEEVKEHLFEPFYTTKPLGQGTGLGLATVHGIVGQSGGHVHVQSEIGRGTSFTICLPPTREEPRRSAPRGSGTVRVRGAVLVLEDDPQVRRVAVRALEGAGFRVLVASHGAEAIELVSREVEPVQLVVADVVLPGVSVRAVVSDLRRRCPTVRILYVSGYTQDAIASKGVLDEGIQFLTKPFTPAGLLERVQELLGPGAS